MAQDWFDQLGRLFWQSNRATSEHHEVRVEGEDQVREAKGDPASKLLDHLHRPWLTVSQEGADSGPVEIESLLTSQQRKPRPRCVHLPAAAPTTNTSVSGCIDDHVPDFSGEPI